MTAAHGIRIKQIGNYKFTIDFGEAFPPLLADEAEPIGGAEGPSPEQLLVAAVTNCLCASLVFALGKFKQDARGVEASSTCRIDRNAEGRLRVQGIDVRISVGAPGSDLPRIDRVLDQFERFCTVSESVKAGVPVTVAVLDGEGRRLR